MRNNQTAPKMPSDLTSRVLPAGGIAATDRWTKASPAKGSHISLLIPVHNPPVNVLEDTIRSVLLQTSDRWELCLCDDASTDPAVLEVLADYRGSDPRIKIVRTEENLHIAEATNQAAEFATGAFVGFLDHDDTLAPHAIETMLQVLEADPLIDVAYSDEDKIEPGGNHSEHYFKPAWSPEHLQSVMYILHFMVIRKSLFLEVGGLRHAYTGAQDYDLALRTTARARKVAHVPGVLYHWRKIPGSAAAVIDAKPQALLNGKAALLDFVQSQEPDATVSDGLFQGSFRVNWPIARDRRPTLLMTTNGSYRDVPGRGRICLVEHALDSIADKSTFRNYEVVLIDNSGKAEIKALAESKGARVVPYAFEGRFNFAAMMNAGFPHVRTEDVILMNDDVEVIAPDWMEALLGLSGRPGVGAVGARLLYPDGRIQHQGMVLGVIGKATHVLHHLPHQQIAYNGFSHIVRNYAAVTGAVLATRMSIVREVGFYDETFGIDYNDVDFCLRLRRAGYRIVYTPFAQLYHFEGSSVVRREVTASDEAAFVTRWGSVIDADPYYNPNLSRTRSDYHLDTW